jgi:hypothetical protein
VPDPGQQPDYRLTLRPLPGSCPPIVRLRQLLKVAVRAFRLRCVAVEELSAGRRPDARGDGAAGHVRDSG